MSKARMNIVVAGGKGHVASFIVQGLLRSTTVVFSVRVLTRRKVEAANDTHHPHILHFIEVDYTNHDQLVSVLRGADVLISAVNESPAAKIDGCLLDAALVAGVPRFFPSDFDLDRTHPHVRETAGEVYTDRYAFQTRLEAEADSGKISWTILSFAEFLDEVNLEWLGFNASKKEATLYDGGKHRATGCSTDFLGDCYAAVFADPDTGNQRILVAEVSYTGLEILQLFEEVMGQKWKVIEDISTAESKRRAERALEAGDLRSAYLAHVLRLNFDEVGAANIEQGFDFRQGQIPRRSLREIIQRVVSNKLSASTASPVG